MGQRGLLVAGLQYIDKWTLLVSLVKDKAPVYRQQTLPDTKPVLLALEKHPVLFRTPRSAVFGWCSLVERAELCGLLRSRSVHKTLPRYLTVTAGLYGSPGHSHRESKAIPMFLYLLVPTTPTGRLWEM